MSGLRKGLLLGGLHLVLLLSLGGKLLLDRATRPRMWLKAAPVDPDLPIRGRYVRLRVEVPVTGVELPPLRPRPKEWRDTEPWPPRWEQHHVQVELQAEGGGLKAVGKSRDGAAGRAWTLRGDAELPERMRALPKESWVVILQEPLAFFIPEHVPDPSRREPGEELWVEVTFPRKGPLRPIRLAVKKGGAFTPLPL
jgi:hypothetical protein